MLIASRFIAFVVLVVLLLLLLFHCPLATIHTYSFLFVCDAVYATVRFHTFPFFPFFRVLIRFYFHFFAFILLCSCSMAMLYVLITFWHFKRRSYYMEATGIWFSRCTEINCQELLANSLTFGQRCGYILNSYVWRWWWMESTKKCEFLLWNEMAISIAWKPPEILNLPTVNGIQSV